MGAIPGLPWKCIQVWVGVQGWEGTLEAVQEHSGGDMQGTLGENVRACLHLSVLGAQSVPVCRVGQCMS